MTSTQPIRSAFRCVFAVSTFAGVVLLATPIANAQTSPVAPHGSDTPLFDVSVGVSMNFTQCDGASAPTPACPNAPKTFPDFGLALSVARSVSDRFALVGEIARHDITYDTVGAGRLRARSANSFVAGPRFATGQGGVRVFGQVLVGVATSDVFPGGFAIQPGVGIDFSRKHPVGCRFEVDDWIVPGDAGHLSGLRILFGLAVRIGSRHP